MSQHRSIFLHGFSLTLRRFPAVLWAYVFNLGLALLFSLRLHTQLSEILNHSLAAQRLINGFDLGAVLGVTQRFHDTPSGGNTDFASIPVFLIVFFLLVPGTLFCYQTAAPARLSTLLHQGILHFWRFLRITILTLLVFGLILGPLGFLQTKWAEHVDDHAVGLHAFLARNAGVLLLFLVASIIRLYFDLVEVYTIQLGRHLRNNGKPDRRVRRTLGPAWRTLRAHFGEAWPVFLFLWLVGAAAVVLTARISLHMLGQPRVWPSFLLIQIGLFVMLFTRFWQRGAETSLALQHAAFPAPQLPIRPVVPYTHPPVTAPVAAPLIPHDYPVTPSPEPLADDPIPDPEPASPPLDEPDPGIYHRNPDKPPL